MATVVASKLSRDPTLIERARDYVKRRLEKASPAERRTHEEWDRILRTMSPARLQKFLVDPSERAKRLRQSLPFADALTAAERKHLLEADHDEG